MFRDDFYRANERLDALGFSTNLIDGKTATNSRANLGSLAEPSKQNARVNLSSNLRASETATSETLGFCRNERKFNRKRSKFERVFAG